MLNTKELADVFARFPFFWHVIGAVFPKEEVAAFVDEVDISEVDAESVLYPDSIISYPIDRIGLPFRRPGEQRRYLACLADDDRLARVLCLQELTDETDWEAMRHEFSRPGESAHVRMPEHVFLVSSYDSPYAVEEILWEAKLHLVLADIRSKAGENGRTVRSATIRFALCPPITGFARFLRA
jgi:hypothetical protein